MFDWSPISTLLVSSDLYGWFVYSYQVVFKRSAGLVLLGSMLELYSVFM